MFKTTYVSPLKLYLDESNPRFRITTNRSQDEIRHYMLKHEDVLSLAKKMVNMNTLLPGERIIIVEENGKKIVLEGNRRTSIYQMFLNRELIPKEYKNRFPEANENFLKEIKRLPADVVNSREEAMPFLAARHIERVREWSSTSQWNISHSYYKTGKNIDEIAEYLVLPKLTVINNIKSYQILLRGINNPQWTTEEKQKLDLFNIKPDKLIRIFKLQEVKNELKLNYDEHYNLTSDVFSIVALDELISILTRRAFIDNTLNTRSDFNDIIKDIENVRKMNFPEDISIVEVENTNNNEFSESKNHLEENTQITLEDISPQYTTATLTSS